MTYRSIFRGIFFAAVDILRNPEKNLERIVSNSSIGKSLLFLLVLGAVTALLTPLQLFLGFEDINGLHAGGQAEYLSMEICQRYNLGIEWRIALIELLYVAILVKVPVIHLILKIGGGSGRLSDTLKMICYGDAPALLFGWVPYFATCAALWAGVIQLLIGPVVVHRMSWARASFIFSVFIGLAIIDIASPLPIRLF